MKTGKVILIFSSLVWASVSGMAYKSIKKIAEERRAGSSGNARAAQSICVRSPLIRLVEKLEEGVEPHDIPDLANDEILHDLIAELLNVSVKKSILKISQSHLASSVIAQALLKKRIEKWREYLHYVRTAELYADEILRLKNEINDLNEEFKRNTELYACERANNERLDKDGTEAEKLKELKGQTKLPKSLQESPKMRFDSCVALRLLSEEFMLLLAKKSKLCKDKSEQKEAHRITLVREREANLQNSYDTLVALGAFDEALIRIGLMYRTVCPALMVLFIEEHMEMEKNYGLQTFFEEYKKSKMDKLLDDLRYLGLTEEFEKIRDGFNDVSKRKDECLLL